MKRAKKRNKAYPFYPQEELADFRELLARGRGIPVAFLCRKEGKMVGRSGEEFYQDVSRFAEEFSRKYPRGEEKIAIIGENCYEYLALFFAIIVSGNVAVPIDKDFELAKILELLRRVGAREVFFSEKYLKEFRGKSGVPETAFLELGLWDEKAQKRVGGNSKKQGSDSIGAPLTSPKKLSAIFFTSGTTGEPKGVMLSQENMLADICYATRNFELREGPAQAFLPFHHGFGLITAGLMPFYYQKTTIITSSLKDIQKDMKEGKPELTFAVPAVVETLYRQIWRGARKQGREGMLRFGVSAQEFLNKIGVDASERIFRAVRSEFGGNLKFVISGGAPLDPKYVKWFRKIGVEILNGYGITEGGPVLAVNRNEYGRDGSVGLAAKGCEVRAIEGEICARGKNIMLGYYKNPKATNEVIRDGWLHTGDLGRVDRDGFIWITGRAKNLIILSNGENVSPEEIEMKLARIEGVSEVIVFQEGEQIVAGIYPEEAFMDDFEHFNRAILEYNRGVAKSQQVAMARLTREELPKNSARKVVRSEAIKEFYERR